MAKAKKIKERSDILIENGVATWDIKAQGAIMGTYLGTFKFRCYLNPSQKLAAGREFRELIGQHPELATDSEKFLAYAMAQLKFRIISAPPFWTSQEMPGDLPDENVITTVLDVAIDAENKFKRMKQTAKDDALERAKKAAERIVNSSVEEDEDEGDEGEDQKSGD